MDNQMKTFNLIISSMIVKTFIIAAYLSGVCYLYGQVQPKFTLSIEQCLKLAEEKKQSGDLRDATDYLNDVAERYWEAKDYRNAIQYYQQSIQLNEQIPNWNGIAGINTNLGLIYSDLKEFEKSYEYLHLAYTYRKKNNEKLSVINALINMSVSLNQMKRYDESVKALEEAVSVARELNDFEKLRSCYGMLSEAYTKSGNFEKAADMFLMFKAAHDALLKENEELYKAELTEAHLLARLAEREKELAEKERELAETRQRYADDELAEMSKAFEELDAEKRELLLNKSRVELMINVTELEKREIETQLQVEQTKSRVFRWGLIVVGMVVLVIGYFLRQKKRDNLRLAQQRDQITEQRREIVDSIHYARHIQNAIMPDPSLRKEIISDHFLFFRPRDIVSGDFYWATCIGNKSVVAIADCTGHGVPGAFLSMLGISSLNEIVLKLGIETASEILDHLRDHIKTTISRTIERRDGMDVALCIIDYDKMELQYAGAYSSLDIVRNGRLTKYTADKMPVGIHAFSDEEQKFTNHVIPVQHNDMLYLFTDGYMDQFGGEKDTKFKSKPFRKLLTKISTLPTEHQKRILIETHEQWKGSGFQVDDILVMGIRIE